MHGSAHLAVLSLDPRLIYLHLASGPGRLLPEGHSRRRLTVSSQDPSGRLERQESRPGHIQPPCCHVLCVYTPPCSILRRIPKHARLFYFCTALPLLCTSSIAVLVRWLAVLHVCELGSAAVLPCVMPWESVVMKVNTITTWIPAAQIHLSVPSVGTCPLHNGSYMKTALRTSIHV